MGAPLRAQAPFASSFSAGAPCRSSTSTTRAPSRRSTRCVPSAVMPACVPGACASTTSRSSCTRPLIVCAPALAGSASSATSAGEREARRHSSPAARNQATPVVTASAIQITALAEAPGAVGVDLERLQAGEIEREQRARDGEHERGRARARVAQQRRHEHRDRADQPEDRQRDAGELAVAALLHLLAPAAADGTRDRAPARPLDLEIHRDDQLEQCEQCGQAARAHPAVPLAFCTAAVIASSEASTVSVPAGPLTRIVGRALEPERRGLAVDLRRSRRWRPRSRDPCRTSRGRARPPRRRERANAVVNQFTLSSPWLR